MRYVFRQFDKEGRGRIEHKQLIVVCTELRNYESSEEVDKIFKAAYSYNSATLSYEEFIRGISP